MNFSIVHTLWMPIGAKMPPMSGNDGTKVTTQADGTVTSQGPDAGDAGLFGGGFMPIFFIVILAFVAMTMFGSRKEKKKKAQLMAAIGKNDTVQTIGGMIGRVVSIQDDRIVLEVDKNSGSRVTLARQAVQQVLTQTDSDSTDTADESTSD